MKVFTLSKRLILGAVLVTSIASADQLILDDLIVIGDGSGGSACVGTDCSDGEVFGFDTIRLKENNVRIKFQDTSNSASFPTNDWQITINDSANGGENFFAVDNIDAGTKLFKISSNGTVAMGGRVRNYF